jgi:hypothetical protein
MQYHKAKYPLHNKNKETQKQSFKKIIILILYKETGFHGDFNMKQKLSYYFQNEKVVCLIIILIHIATARRSVFDILQQRRYSGIVKFIWFAMDFACF